jgi:predicted nucleic acid-binding protein
MVKPKLFGADTNFLMDLADEKDAAWSCWEIGKQRGHSFLILPVVAGELFYLSESGQAKDRALASLALERAIAEWKFTPRDLSDTETEIARLGAENILHEAVIPTGEFNDAFLVCQAAVEGIPCLLSNDAHLKDCDQERLQAVLQNRELSPVIIFRYGSYIRSFGSQR